ncbi:hypothetical protein BJX61DRAFT_546477 [Aspergillus egyptiacus]|nr:hypothetical protein BJX61DRAFT_546477 [Aspergillus egyptiacus]
MRFLILSLLIALFVAMASGHTVTCFDKSKAADSDGVIRGIEFMRHVEGLALHGPGGTLPSAAGLDAHSCEFIYCHHKTSIRWCNDNDRYRMMEIEHIREGTEVLFRDCRKKASHRHTVAGGVIDHPDKWKVILEGDDRCNP